MSGVVVKDHLIGTGMQITATADSAKVIALEAVFIAAAEKWRLESGHDGVMALDIMTALLCAVCRITNNTPTDEMRAQYASEAVDFIFRNSGTDAVALCEGLPSIVLARVSVEGSA